MTTRPFFKWPKMDDGSALVDVIDALNRRLGGLGFTVAALLGYLDQVQDEALKALTWLFAWGNVTTATPDVSQAIVQRVTAGVAVSQLVRPAGESVSFIILVAMGAGVSIVNSANLRLIGGSDVTLESGEARLFAAVNLVSGNAVWQEVGPHAIAGTTIALGAIPATAGQVRLANNTGGVVTRNAANSGDVTMIRVGPTNIVEIDANGFGASFAGPVTLVGGLISYGAADSAGTGYRTVRVPN